MSVSLTLTTGRKICHLSSHSLLLNPCTHPFPQTGRLKPCPGASGAGVAGPCASQPVAGVCAPRYNVQGVHIPGREHLHKRVLSPPGVSWEGDQEVQGSPALQARP